MRKALSNLSLLLFVFSLKGALFLARLVPMLAPGLRTLVRRQTFERLSKERKFVHLNSLSELPSDAEFFVAHEMRSKIWLYPCETQREAAAYRALAQRRKEPVTVYRGIPDRLNAGSEWMYYPALVAPTQTITPRRRAWIDAMQTREEQRLRLRLGITE